MPSYSMGQLVKEVRMRKKWSIAKLQEQSQAFADEESGAILQTLVRMERNWQNPYPNTAAVVMEALDMPVNQFFCPYLEQYDAKVSYKIYPNSKAVPLIKQNQTNQAMKPSFVEVLATRKSTRSFSSSNVDLSTLSQFLTLGCGHRDDAPASISRTYPSAGGRFPIEIYIAILRSDDIERGVYHYNVKDGALELIKSGDFSQTLHKFYERQKLETDYPCLIFFSLVFNRTMGKYGERGYRYALLDAGHMGQNLYLVATYLGLGIVGFGQSGVSDKVIEDFLGIASSKESLVYSFALGHPQK
ncbi:MAG: SagB/ThcOx family dehydrogenase [Oscillospiraceae bacterium]|nr:SagB/ThcOx family dehydrogenase [Oscillospiraceae bacterium]